MWLILTSDIREGLLGIIFLPQTEGTNNSFSLHPLYFLGYCSIKTHWLEAWQPSCDHEEKEGSF